MRLLLLGLICVTTCAAWQPDVDVESWSFEGFANLNEQIEKGISAGAGWTSDPLRITVELFGGCGEEPSDISINVDINRVEGADTAVVIVVTDGYLDDSMRGSWHRIVYILRPDYTWRVNEVRRAVRCRRGRGPNQESFGAQGCL